MVEGLDLFGTRNGEERLTERVRFILIIIFFSLFRVRATLICAIVLEPGSRFAFCILRYCSYQLYFVFHLRAH